MSNQPEVTIVVPTRNRWPLLSTYALPSALGQEAVELEVVVVDDASEDETVARLGEIRDARLRVVRLESRRRLAGARNAGLAAARGRWVAFLDDDDLWAPRKVREQIDAAEAARAEWAYSAALVVDGDLRTIESHPFPEPAELATLLLRGNFVPGGGSNVIATADLIRRVGAFDEHLRFFEDWDLWLRLARESLPAACPHVHVARLEHGANMLFRDGPDIESDYLRLLGKHRPATDDDRRTIAEWIAFEHHRGGYHAKAARFYFRAAVRHRSPGNLVACVGALFGERGLAAASRLLVALRGATHLSEQPSPPGRDPEWLEQARKVRR